MSASSSKSALAKLQVVGEAAGILALCLVAGPASWWLADWLLADYTVLRILFALAACLALGCVGGLVWSKIAWPRRRLALLRSWGLCEACIERYGNKGDDICLECAFKVLRADADQPARKQPR